MADEGVEDITAPNLVLAAGSMLDCNDRTLIESAASAGFSGVGLRISPDAGSHRLGEARRAAEDLGVALHDVEVHRIGSASSTGNGRGSPEASALIEAAAALGASQLLVVSDIADRSESIDRLAAIVATAADAGVGVALEYMAWTTPSTPDDALSFADATGCTVVVDVLHHVRVGAGVAELDRIVMSGHLGWAQLCDARLRPRTDPDLAVGRHPLLHEARHDRLIPGTGSLPLHDLLPRLPAGTALSVEVQSDELLGLEPRDRAQLLHDATAAVLRDATAAVLRDATAAVLRDRGPQPGHTPQLDGQPSSTG